MNDNPIQMLTFLEEGWSSIAEVNTHAIRENLRWLRSRVDPGILQMAVIKADAYGHGAAEVGIRIQDDIDWIGVYQVREGAELRDSGISLPILVFGTPTAETARFYLEYNLVATVSRFEHFDVLLPGTAYHIKFDTGMGRVGFLPEDVTRVEREIHTQAHIRYTGLMTHFADSEVIGSEIFEVQKEHFSQIVEKLGEHVTVHASNSGATVHQQHVHYDLIRNGTSIYGFDPNGKSNASLTPALAWKSRLVQVRHLPKGAGVSYSHKWHMPTDGFVGIIPVGYADGINRNLSGKMVVEIGGKTYPQVGNITMDQIVVFLGSDDIQVGSEVVLLGGRGDTSAYRWADILGTITYEVTCMIGNRVKRVYI